MTGLHCSPLSSSVEATWKHIAAAGLPRGRPDIRLVRPLYPTTSYVLRCVTLNRGLRAGNCKAPHISLFWCKSSRVAWRCTSGFMIDFKGSVEHWQHSTPIVTTTQRRADIDLPNRSTVSTPDTASPRHESRTEGVFVSLDKCPRWFKKAQLG